MGAFILYYIEPKSKAPIQHGPFILYPIECRIKALVQHRAFIMYPVEYKLEAPMQDGSLDSAFNWMHNKGSMLDGCLHFVFS